jgi:hypothetical protein
LVFVYRVFCDAGTGFLNIISINFKGLIGNVTDINHIQFKYTEEGRMVVKPNSVHPNTFINSEFNIYMVLKFE